MTAAGPDVIAGDLLLVTGPSGVGKSTITEMLQRDLSPDWLLWQADRCQPRTGALPASLSHEEALRLEARMFAANLGAIAAYLQNGWSVVAELAVMSPSDAAAVHAIAPGRSAIVQLDCSPETLSSHLSERETPVPDAWATDFYKAWVDVGLPAAIKINVDGRSPDEVVRAVIANRTERSS